MKPSSAALRSILHNMFQLRADKRRTSLTFCIPDSINGAACMHAGPPDSLQSWNDGQALNPDSGLLLRRTERLAGKARQHLSDKPMAVRERHRHGRTKMSTHAIIAQGAVGPAEASIQKSAIPEQLPMQMCAMSASTQPASSPAMPASRQTAPQQPLPSQLAATPLPHPSIGLQSLGPPSAEITPACAGLPAGTSLQPQPLDSPTADIAPACTALPTERTLQPGPSAQNIPIPPLPETALNCAAQVSVRCKQTFDIFNTSQYSSASAANFNDSRWQAGKAGKESRCKCIEVSDASGTKQQLTAGAFEKSAGCKDKNAKLSIHASMETGAITLIGSLQPH